MFGISELAVVLIIVIAVLAARKLPELARSAGKSARILKAEARAMKEENRAADGAAADTAPRIVRGKTVGPGTGPAAGGTERPSAPVSEWTGRTKSTPRQDGRP
ncbi:twin-arginine translocase TatA/TatE family subunit [Streptomyces sp. NPDC006134]|uniref:twin-arginine translocase TatA/TatE family subunit n=1 Tax=Streptomyces sp. NPDC006134 TaxID=3154467 RepID=UPI0033E80D94